MLRSLLLLFAVLLSPFAMAEQPTLYLSVTGPSELTITAEHVSPENYGTFILAFNQAEAEVRGMTMHQGQGTDWPDYFGRFLDLRVWGPGPICTLTMCHPSDLDCDGVVNVADLLLLLQEDYTAASVLGLLADWGKGWDGGPPGEVLWQTGFYINVNGEYIDPLFVNYPD